MLLSFRFGDFPEICFFIVNTPNLSLFCWLHQVVAAGANPIQITRGIERTTKALVDELKLMSKEVKLKFFMFNFSNV